MILRCDVVASCPIDQLAATVANAEEEFENAGVRRLGLWDGVSILRDVRSRSEVFGNNLLSKERQDKSFLDPIHIIVCIMQPSGQPRKAFSRWRELARSILHSRCGKATMYLDFWKILSNDW